MTATGNGFDHIFSRSLGSNATKARIGGDMSRFFFE